MSDVFLESIVPDGPGPGEIKLTFSTAKARPSIDLLVVSIKTRDCPDKGFSQGRKVTGQLCLAHGIVVFHYDKDTEYKIV